MHGVNTRMPRCPSQYVETALDLNHIHLFDKETELTIIPRIPEYNYVDCEISGGKLTFSGATVELPPAVKCKDGNGELLIPTDAMSVADEGVLAKVVGFEEISGTKLLCVEIGGRRFYLTVAEQISDENVHIKLDMKRITVNMDGKDVVTPMAGTVRFDGKLVKVKEKREVDVVKHTKDGDVTTKKLKTVVDFDLNIAGASYPASDAVALKLISTLGVSHAFTKELIFECTPYDIKITEQGIEASLKTVLDYGSERFAVYTVGELSVPVYLPDEAAAPASAHLSPELSKVGIIQKDMDIRII